jgi:hypothetical protein
MIDRGAARKGKALGWTIAIAGGVGFYFGLTHRNLEPLVRPAAALVLVLAGMILLFPLVAFRPKSDDERTFRFRTSATGAGNIAFGVAQLIPNQALRLTLGVVTLLLMLAAFRGIPKRLLASRV